MKSLEVTRILTIISFIFFNLYLNSSSICQLVYVYFSTLSDGFFANNSITSWNIEASQVPEALCFAVNTNHFHVRELEDQSIWYSKVIAFTEYPNFQIGIKITTVGKSTNSEYVKIFNKLKK